MVINEPITTVTGRKMGYTGCAINDICTLSQHEFNKLENLAHILPVEFVDCNLHSTSTLDPQNFLLAKQTNPLL